MVALGHKGGGLRTLSIDCMSISITFKTDRSIIKEHEYRQEGNTTRKDTTIEQMRCKS